MSKLDPLYVYNQHRSPVSALCFGQFDGQDVIVTGDEDGELHVWNVTNFMTLIKIQLNHASRIVALECVSNRRSSAGVTHSTVDQQQDSSMKHRVRCDATNCRPADQSGVQSRTGAAELSFVSQTKNGQLAFIELYKDEENIQFNVYKQLRCSDCTFCPLQSLTIGRLTSLVYISRDSSNCADLLLLNGDLVLVCKRVAQLDQEHGIISSMKMTMNASGLILLAIGTESGCCLIYASELRMKPATQSGVTDDLAVDESSIDAFVNGFTLKYKQNAVFKDTFISALELIYTDERSIQLICGSAEDCLAFLNLNIDNASIDECADDGLSQSSSSSNNALISLRTAGEQSVKYLKITNKGISSIASRSDRKLFASCGWDGRIRLFSLRTRRPLAVLTFHRQTIEMIKFSTYLPNYKGYLLAAAGGQEKLVTIWSIYNG